MVLTLVVYIMRKSVFSVGVCLANANKQSVCNTKITYIIPLRSILTSIG